MSIAIFTGFITPIGDTPFTYLIKQMENNIISGFIIEMQPIIPVSSWQFITLGVIYATLLTFTDTKIKLSDIFLILGFTLMTLYSVRSIYYLIWIGAIPLTRLLNDFFVKYGENELKSLNNILNRSKIQKLLLMIICIVSIYFYLNINLDANYVDEEEYPIYASKYIIENLDINNIRLYNSYNYGSYLEMFGIPVFIDSRADIWSEEFNDTTVLEDEAKMKVGDKTYMEVFDKYSITHVLVKKDDIVNVYISEDDKYEKIYNDDWFYLYEKK